MARINARPTPERTHEGAVAKRINPELLLRRSVMSCLLWEKEFYEDGETISDRITGTIPLVKADKVADLAVEAREKGKLRHVPLLLVREMARLNSHRHTVERTLDKIIQRADELAEFVAIYWKDGKQPLSAQVKRGLARAFSKFNEYQLSKYNRDGAVKLRDVLFLCHAKPKDKEQDDLWKRLINGTLTIPDTWETALSSGADKKETWERLIQEKKLGGLALLRNLRNMIESGVSRGLIQEAISSMKTDRILPFRFLSAAKYAPKFEPELESAMFKCVADREKLPGHTVLLVDVSGSMDSEISSKSDLKRWEAAAALAILAREICESCAVYVFSTTMTEIPARRGFSLRDAMARFVGGGTQTGGAVRAINEREKYDRLIIFTDEQSHDSIPNPTGKGYVVNVASNKNGIGYGAWTHIDGFSESILDYITEVEKTDK